MSTSPEQQTSDFLSIERALVGWWEQAGVEVLNHGGEWFVELDGRRFSIGGQALAVADEIGLLR